jgi:hypothetical protein
MIGKIVLWLVVGIALAAGTNAYLQSRAKPERDAALHQLNGKDAADVVWGQQFGSSQIVGAASVGFVLFTIALFAGNVARAIEGPKKTLGMRGTSR